MSSSAGGRERGSGNNRARNNRLKFRLGEIRIAITIPEAAGKGGAMFVSNWRQFSRSELAILRLLLDGKARSREEIARELNESPDGKIKSTLATLADRECLLITQDGYKANLAEDELEAARKWLQSVN